MKLFLFHSHHIWITSKCKSFLSQNFIQFCSFGRILIVTVTHIVLKTDFIYIFPKNYITFISCLNQFLNIFLVFSKWTACTVSKFRLPYTAQKMKFSITDFFIFCAVLNVHQCRIENFSICFNLCKNNTLKISHC